MTDCMLGPHGEHLIKSYEAFYAYVYDDKATPVHGRSPEWTGGPVKGTLTIGWGHTDAARDPTKCTLGLRITEERAEEIFVADMSECVEDVNRYVLAHRPLSQGQLDALVSFRFNCGLANLRKLVEPLIAGGDYAATRAKFPLYNRSGGEVMAGLVRRRKAEQALWDDDYDPTKVITKPVTPDQHANVLPDAAPVSRPPGHVNPTAAAAGAGAVLEAGHELNDALSQITTTADTVDSFTKTLTAMAADPWLWLTIGIAIGLLALWYAHYRHTEI
jgi:GH24 family phage-related lysozyme (muramidase)